MKLNNLLQNPLNRKIDRAKVAEIKRAIKTSGVIKPLVYTEVMTEKGKENMLTDGHHRYVALKEMGYKDAPVVMSDERGIDTAQFQDMKTVKKAITVLRSLSKHLDESINKAKKPCREGYYRDKDGNCRRRGQRYYGDGALIYGPRRHHDNGHGTENGSTSPSNGTTQKHLQGQHDQSTHSPTGRSAVAREWERKPKTRQEATRRGAVKGGAIHLGTIAIPALATAAIIRGASYLRFGVIGAGVALIIYETPQLAFRIAEGAARERKEFERDRKVKKANAETDKANRTIERGDHLLVLYNKQANIGVYLGNDKARLVNGPKFVDVRTSKNNRLKIASGQGVPSTSEINVTRRILRQIKLEQKLVNQIAQQAQTNKVLKHTPGGQSHNQQDHDPTKGKTTTRLDKPIEFGGGESGGSIITSSSRVEGKIQVTHFTEEGQPSGHDEYDTLQDALLDNLNSFKNDRRLPQEIRDSINQKGEWIRDFREAKSRGGRGDYVYISPFRPISMDKELPNAYNVSGKNRAVIFSDSKLTLDLMSRKTIVPFNENALGSALVDFYTKRVEKHGTHNQQDHDPTKGKGKAPASGKTLRAQLRPAFRLHGKVYAGKRGQTHADVYDEKSKIRQSFRDVVDGFVDAKGNFMTRNQALNRVGIASTEDVKNTKKKSQNIFKENTINSLMRQEQAQGVRVSQHN